MRTTVFFLLAGLAFAPLAQEDAGLDDEENTAETKVEAEATKQAETGTAKKVQTPDSFEASEQLSEDVPAPFPVDI